MQKGILALAGVLSAASIFGTTAANAAAPLAWSSPVTQISPTNSPYNPGCANSDVGTNFPGTEVEPWVTVNPADPGNVIAVWQQDRYSNGGSNGLRAAFTSSGVWHEPAVQPPFTACAGGSGDSGGYERASDPWVAFNSNGTIAYFMALAFDQKADLTSAMTMSRSTDGGAHWTTPAVLKRDTSPYVLNDKNSVTADRFDPLRAYAVWDRLVFPNERSHGKSFENAAAFYGPTWFSSTTDGGDSWTTRKIWDPADEHHNSGRNDQAIGNQIVQTDANTLVDVFDYINNDNAGGNTGGGRKGYKVAVLRSTDAGDTWSHAQVVANFVPGTVHDPTTGQLVRSGDIIPEVAVDPQANSNTVYLVWQAASASSPSSVYFSRSTDAGQSWSAPVVINTHTGTEAFTPAVRVDSKGDITVTYYDFRDDAGPDSNGNNPLTTDYWSIISRDGGQTWDESQIGGSFDMRGAAYAYGLFVGDYEGLGAGENTDVFHAVFGQATGSPGAEASDIEDSDATD